MGMKVEELDSIEFGKRFPEPNHVFNKPEFNLLNKAKVSEVLFLAFSNNNKSNIGIIGGVSNNQFRSPFSAPFGGWCYKGGVDIEELELAYDALENYLSAKQVKGIRITMPPLFYNESEISVIWNVFHRKKYSIVSNDLNFQFNLGNFTENYLQDVAYNARKNYNAGMRAGLCFYKVSEPEKIKEAYDIISENRKQRGFPLKMSFDNILETNSIIDADFFIVTDNAGKNAAAAMVFKVTDKIVQVVYWGHLAEFSSFKPVNFLSYNLFDYYKKMGMEYVDIGPSTENSIPNYGLVEFKRSIGCDVSPKLTFEKEI
jgi:hypothetical protein